MQRRTLLQMVIGCGLLGMARLPIASRVEMMETSPNGFWFETEDDECRFYEAAFESDGSLTLETDQGFFNYPQDGWKIEDGHLWLTEDEEMLAYEIVDEDDLEIMTG